MLFEKAFRQTLKYYIYAERYINDGSPSGFTFINQVGKRYRPTSGYSNFKLPVFNIRKETAVLIGDINDILNKMELEDDWEKIKEFLSLKNAARTTVNLKPFLESKQREPSENDFKKLKYKIKYQQHYLKYHMSW